VPCYFNEAFNVITEAIIQVPHDLTVDTREMEEHFQLDLKQNLHF